MPTTIGSLCNSLWWELHQNPFCVVLLSHPEKKILRVTTTYLNHYYIANELPVQAPSARFQEAPFLWSVVGKDDYWRAGIALPLVASLQNLTKIFLSVLSTFRFQQSTELLIFSSNAKHFHTLWLYSVVSHFWGVFASVPFPHAAPIFFFSLTHFLILKMHFKCFFPSVAFPNFLGRTSAPIPISIVIAIINVFCYIIYGLSY